MRVFSNFLVVAATASQVAAKVSMGAVLGCASCTEDRNRDCTDYSHESQVTSHKARWTEVTGYRSRKKREALMDLPFGGSQSLRAVARDFFTRPGTAWPKPSDRQPCN